MPASAAKPAARKAKTAVDHAKAVDKMPLEKLMLAAYSQPEEKRRAARARIRKLTADERKLVAPAGLTGRSLRVFISTGMLGTEQIEQARLEREKQEALDAAATQDTKQQDKPKRNRKAKEAKMTKTTEKPAVDTKAVAEKAGITPRQLRIFLRAHREQFPKTDGQYGWPTLTAARPVVTAAKRWTKEQAKAKQAKAAAK